MNRRISVSVGLEINNKLIGLIRLFSSSHSLKQLILNIWIFTRRFWREGIYIAIGTTSISFTTIPIRAGKTTIYNYFEYPLTIIFFTQVHTITIIAFNPHV